MAMHKLSGTRVPHGPDAGKNMRTGSMPGGGPVASPRAQKPVKGSENFSTIKVSASEKTTRPVTGAKK